MRGPVLGQSGEKQEFKQAFLEASLFLKQPVMSSHWDRNFIFVNSLTIINNRPEQKYRAFIPLYIGVTPVTPITFGLH